MSDKRFYIYRYRDPRDGSVIYVGKGCDNRAMVHWSEKSHNVYLQRILDKIRAANLEPIIEILEWFDDEFEAYRYEKKLIEIFGQRTVGTGTLCNIIAGTSGRVEDEVVLEQELEPEPEQELDLEISSPEIDELIEAISKQSRRLDEVWREELDKVGIGYRSDLALSFMQKNPIYIEEVSKITKLEARFAAEMQKAKRLKKKRKCQAVL